MLTPNQLKVFDFINSYIKAKEGTTYNTRDRLVNLRVCTFKHLEDLKEHRATRIYQDP